MASAALDWLLENLQLLLLHEAHVIVNAKTQIEQLDIDLRLLKASLTESIEKRGKEDEVLQELLRLARDVIYEAEDVIDDFFVAQAGQRRSSFSLKDFRKSVKPSSLSVEVEKLSAKVKSISSKDISGFHIKERSKEEIKATPVVREKKVVGIDDEKDTLIRYLTEKTEHLDVITIVGMPGIGKTTLAYQIYRDPIIQHEFPTLIWIHVSNNFTYRDVFVSILRQLMTKADASEKSDEELAQQVLNKLTTADASGKSDEELAQQVLSHLERGRFLIVMDDLCSVDDWERLGIALPASNNWGKVLITTCNEEVGRHANASRFPHNVRLLNETESWRLLQLEVFGEIGKCPSELENIGRLIAKQCDGLPLAVVVMGSILVKRDQACADMTARRNQWIKACQDVPTYRNQKFYNVLPQHLQICFLYFGVFPPNLEISVRSLISMWIAEGFITRHDSATLEETAEKYLNDLISRHLVEADKIKSNGKVKTCRIHGMLHDFCKIQAGKEMENVLQEIKFRDGVFEPPSSQLSIYRRLCIHSNVLGFLSSNPSGPRVRSLVSFSKDEFNLPTEYSVVIPAAFKLLRVLDVKPIIFSKIPSDMYQLVLLRYLVFSSNLDILPASFSRLSNLQTLIANTTSRTLEIKADFTTWTQLRHFKTNASASLPKVSKTRECQNLQTLGTISPQSCTEELFAMAGNLKKLGICGQLSFILHGQNESFDWLGRMINLTKLKLINDEVLGPASEARVRSLPPAYKFPPNLTSLTLAHTFLDWSQMSILGRLDKLEVLKLKDNAFVGHDWVTDDGGFRSLEALHIGRTDLVIWVASAYQFPRLKHLELHYCEELREVPIELADIATFQRLDLFRTKLAAASANRILERKKKYQEGSSMKVREFKLSIYPPVNDHDLPY